MIIQNSSDLIRHHQPQVLANGTPVHEAELINGHAVIIGHDSLSLYRRPGDCADPLGNGFIRSVSLPDNHRIPQEAPMLQEHRAGFAGLVGGYVLLIGLNDIRLFSSREDALRNRNELVRLALGD